MNNPEYVKQPFRSALERYVFGIANKFIESAGQTTQSELISLINQLDLGGATDANSASPGSEWQQILDKPVDWQSVYKQWLVDVMQKRTLRDEYYMDNLNKAIQHTEIRLQQTEDTFLREPYRSKLLHWHKLTLDYYHRHLAAMRTVHQLHLNQLDQLLSR